MVWEDLAGQELDWVHIDVVLVGRVKRQETDRVVSVVWEVFLVLGRCGVFWTGG